MKKYIKINSTDIDYLMNYNESVTLEDFTENIKVYVDHRSRIEPEHKLEFFIEESWTGDYRTLQLSCQRLETDFEYEDRMKQDEISTQILKKSKLIEELKKLTKEDLNEVLGYVNETK